MAASAVDTKTTLEFTQVNRVYTQTNKRSALYNYVSEEIEALQKQGLEVKSIENENRNAFLIFSKAEFQPLELFQREGYQCTDRHLTIDKFYAEDITRKGLQGYSYAHYTEQYLHLESSEEIVVHAYFNRLGQYIYCQVKQSPDQYLEVNHTLEGSVKSNCAVAQKVLRDLLAKKTKHYIEALQASDELERELINQSKHLDIEDNQKRYLEVANIFLNQIEILNKYNDLEQDNRSIFVIQIMKKIEKKHPKENIDKSISINDGKSQNQVETTIEQSTSSGNNANDSEQDLKLMKPAVIEEVLALENELDKKLNQGNKNLKNQVEALLLVKKLQENLLELMIAEEFSKKLSKSRKKIIDRLERKILNIPSFAELWIQCISEANLEVFGLLHLFGKNKYSLSNVENLLRSVVYENDEKLRLSRIEMCDYLYENSERYRQMLIYVGFSFRIFEGEFYTLSLLVKAAQLRNSEAFVMLLRQGFDSNGNGLYYNKMLVSNLKATIYFSKDEVRFVELLLQYGATLDKPREKFMENPQTLKPKSKAKKEIVSMAKESKPIVQEILEMTEKSKENHANNDHEILNAIMSAETDISLACDFKRYKVIGVIQKKCELFTLALALAKLANQSGNSMRFLPSSTDNGVTYVAQEQLNVLTQTEFEIFKKNGTKNQFQYAIYSKTEEPEMCKVIKEVCVAIKEKYGNSQEDINEILERLESKAKSYQNVKDAYSSRNYYFACLFLMCQKKQLTEEDVLKMMKYNCYIGSLFYGQSVAESKALGIAYYNIVISLAKLSSYLSSLIDSPIYKLAHQKVENFELNQQDLQVEMQQRSNIRQPMLYQFSGVVNVSTTANVPNQIEGANLSASACSSKSSSASAATQNKQFKK